MNYEIRSPETMRKDFENYLAERSHLDRLMREGKLSPEEYRANVRKIETDYSRKIHKEDRILFNDETEYLDFINHLKTLNPENREELEWSAKHEREHYEAAVSDPAVKARYCFWMLREEDGETSGVPAVYIESEESENHYLEARKRAIVGAKELSPLDELDL